MKTFRILAGLCLAARCACPAAAETFTLKNGSKLEAQEITPEGNWVKLKLDQGEVFIPKSDLSADQVERYFSSGDGKYLTFQTVKTGEEIEYVYFDRGKRTGRRVIGADGVLRSTEGAISDGNYREFYPGDGVEKSVTLINGRQTGAFKIYFPDGKQQSEAYFLNDVRHGPTRVFDEDGNIISEEKYLYGVRQEDSVGQAVADAEPDPEEPADPPQKPARPKRPAKLFISPEVFSISGADSKWRVAFQKARAAAAAAYASSDARIKTYPGYGARTGLNLGGFLSPFSLAYSFVFGPAYWSRIDVTAAGGAEGEKKETIRIFYQRAMLELKVPLVTLGDDSLNLQAGTGRAFGTIVARSTLSGPALPAAPAETRTSALWSGPAYDVGLSVTSRYANGNWLELGARYSHFPPRPEDKNWSRFTWDPVSGYLTLAF